jgi:adenine-specific DNA-methyltransferase
MPPRKGPTRTPVEHLTHPTASSPTRPEVGVQAQFNAPPAKQAYRYDSSLAPALDWDDRPARVEGEALIRQILEAASLEDAKAAAAKLKAMGQPFLDWAGKAERLSFDVPTLPLFVHERLSTKAIIQALQAHEREGCNTPCSTCTATPITASRTSA